MAPKLLDALPFCRGEVAGVHHASRQSVAMVAGIATYPWSLT
jgi:hypothetical protein